MFKQLAGMLNEGDALSISVVAVKDGRLALTIVPKGDFKNKDLGTGLSLEATPDEFDSDLSALLVGYVNTRRSLKEQVEAQALVLAEAEKASKTATAKAISKATPAKPTTRPAATPATGSVDADDDESDLDDDASPASAKTGETSAPAAAVTADASAAVELF